MGFFSNFWTWLNAQLATYIGTKTAAIANALLPVAVPLATIYVMVWGYLQLTGRIKEPIVTGAVRVFVLIAVFGVALHLWLYNYLLVDTFHNAPDQLAAALVGAPSTVMTIDQIWSSGAAVGDQLLANGGVFGKDIVFYLAGFVVYFIIGLVCVYAVFLIALSKVALSIILALGPLFIIGLLFDTTKRFFEAWIAQLANYALITVLAVAVGGLLLSIVRKFAMDTAAIGADIKVTDAADMLLISVIVFLVMRQVMPIAAGLASGIALSTYGLVSGTVSRALGGAARSGYQFGRGVLDARAGEAPSRWDSMRRRLGNRAGQLAWRQDERPGGSIRETRLAPRPWERRPGRST
jgi:type IV secretion system protein VirB6